MMGMTEKRFTRDNHTGYLYDNGEIVEDIMELLNSLADENEQLKQYISKIDFAIIRKYDNSLENLLDEIYDGEYENWVKKQVSRAKKLDGDVE